MPIYEYRCDACQRTFEKFHRSATAEARAECPECGAPARRLLSIFAQPRGAAPGPDDPEHPGPPAGESDHGHDHGFGGHSHDALHGHSH